ncbi:hypothetical protein B0H16DRAFT_1456707 [Mycena metata]|uniref:Uncharacterized protein n=1 Tax=Mycena metata TaxID=1033252 RepID=A0AAD7J9V2_9AGAR|nr:hypothetical protein B0H16DRAFT_1456707 [Mycena metata]
MSPAYPQVKDRIQWIVGINVVQQRRHEKPRGMTEESGHITALPQTTVHIEGRNTGNSRTMQRWRRVVCWIGRKENPLDNFTSHKTASATLQKVEVNQRQVVWPKRPSSRDEEGSPNKAVKSTSSFKRDPGDHRKKKNNRLHKLGGNGRECAGATTRWRIYERRKHQYNAAHGSKRKPVHQNIPPIEFEGRKRSGNSPAQTKDTVYKAPSDTTDEYDVLRRDQWSWKYDTKKICRRRHEH